MENGGKTHENNMLEYIYYMKVINYCTTPPLLYISPQMRTCESFIYRCLLPVTFLFFSFLFLLLFVKRGTTQWKRLYIIIIMLLICFFLISSTAAPIDGKGTVAHFSRAYSQDCIFCPLNSRLGCEGTPVVSASIPLCK